MRDASSIQVILIASGPTEWDSTHRFQGNTDLPLSADGLTYVEQQAMDHPLLQGTSAASVRWVYCSPDEASRQTGSIFARAVDARIKPVEDLAEMNLGLWQGLTTESLAERYAKSYEYWNQTPAAVSIPDGETIEQAAERMQYAVGRLMHKADADQPLALVLRPILRGLCHRWLSGRTLDDWRVPENKQTVTILKVNPADLATPGRRRRRIVA